MPIFSYLATPKEGARDRLCADLVALAHCQIIPADNHELIVLVTDTPNETTEETLQESLKNLQSLQSLDLAFGYNESNDEN
jgi:nitrate reductase NapAB chaperone NapD